MKRREAFDTLDEILEELEAARFGLSQTRRVMDGDLNVVRAGVALGVGHRELRRCEENLEITYVMRLFSEFEGLLQAFWRQGVGRRTRPRARQLIDLVAAVRGISAGHTTGAHEVREYRNDVVHQQLRDARLTSRECASRLGRYLSWLPESW